MSLASLESVLEMTAAQISPGQPNYSSLIEEDGITPKRTLPNWIIRPVQEEIEATAELSEFAKNTIRTPDGETRLSAWDIAKLLVYRLFARIEPKQIIADILDFSRGNEYRTCTYVGLYGGGINTFDALRVLYGARSKAVHKGTLDPAIIPRFPEFDLLCSRIIRCILAQRNFPDWDQLVLGDKQAPQIVAVADEAALAPTPKK